MTKKNKNNKKKIKGEASAKIVWIIGALFLGAMAVSSFTAIGKEAESTLDCLREGTKYLVYFLAYVLGLIYLFRPGQKSSAFFCAILCTVAGGLSFLLELTDGGRMAEESVVQQILMILAYFLFAVFAGILVKGQKMDLYAKCLKFWYLPAALLFLAGLLAALWTELARPAGFLWDGFILDMAANILLLLPVLTMTLVVRERKISEE